MSYLALIAQTRTARSETTTDLVRHKCINKHALTNTEDAWPKL